MTYIELNVNGANASANVVGKLTAGAVGIKVCCHFNDDWNTIIPQLIARCNGVDREMVIDAEGISEVPHECLISGSILILGVRGWNADGTIYIPTRWAHCATVYPSADDAQPSEPKPVTPDIVDQINKLAYDADVKAQNAFDKADDVYKAYESGDFKGDKGDKGEKGDKGDPGAVDEKTIAQNVVDYLSKHPVEAPVKSVNGQTGDVLINIPDISGKQDKITDLATIRAGASKGATALQSFTEKDPTVPSWAKQPTKPSYSYNELTDKPSIPATYDDTKIKEDLSWLSGRVSTVETELVGVSALAESISEVVG